MNTIQYIAVCLAVYIYIYIYIYINFTILYYLCTYINYITYIKKMLSIKIYFNIFQY